MHGIIFALLADNGRQFNNHAFNEFYNNLGVELKFCSPAHPKVNGQAKTTKKIIKKLLKTWSGEKNGPWVDELVVVLWAYKTTHKTAMSETPFALAFGHEAVIPTEIGVTTHRTNYFGESENDEQIYLNLDLLADKKEVASRRATTYQQRVAHYYNKKVRIRQFKFGDWVLKSVNQNTRNPNQVAFGPNQEGPYRVLQATGPKAYKLAYVDGHEVKRSWNVEHLKKYFQ